MPTKYVPYTPEPIEGQALLDNFKRILKYKENYTIKDKLILGMPLYEMKKVESIRKGNKKETECKNLVIRGECISACAYLKDQGKTVDLVYIDPPFASGADYAKKVYIRRNPDVAKAIKTAEEEMDIEELKSFEEKMYGDVWDKEKYLNWMFENLCAIKSIMSENASIWVHLDWHISHYVKILMDEIFGEYNFRNEIIWCYSGGAIPVDRLPKKHDVIFWYGMKEKEGVIYNPEYKAYSEGSVQRGRSQCKGENAKLREEGTPITDWWTDIKKITSPTDYENLNYATQKSEELLSRIIKLSSNENMIVADFFGGSGVTAAAANKLNRNFIHCDIGINSIQTTRDRLLADKADFDVLEIQDGVSLFRNPVQTNEKLRSIIQGLVKLEDANDFWAGCINTAQEGTIPVYLPDLKNSNSKILDKIFISRLLHEQLGKLSFTPEKVIIYYVDISNKDEIESFIKQDKSTTTKIELRDLKKLLDDIVIEDTANFNCESIQDGNDNCYKLIINSFMSDRVMRHINEYNAKSSLNDSKKKFKPIVISDNGIELIEWISLDCTSDNGEWHSDKEIKIDKLGYVINDGEKTKDFWDKTIISTKKPLRLKIRNICGDETIWKIK